MKKLLKLALVDDDKLVVELLLDYLLKAGSFEVVWVAYGGNEALKKLEVHSDRHPDVILLDLKMDEGSGLETVDHLHTHYPDLKIIVLSSYYKASFMGFMLHSGVHAFLPKGTSKENLKKIIFEVNERGFYYTSDQINVIRKQISSRSPKPQFSATDKLSSRETEVLKLICLQYTAKEIADKLFISPKTVESHKGHLLAKTGVKNTAGLIIYAIQNQIVKAEELMLLD